jgi:peptidoglycan/LPS O-acetylase OafA/YrhL
MMHLREIDGLRAVAVLSVILFHAGIESFRGGFVGVDIFFVISGFLITKIIAQEIKNRTFRLPDFYIRRIRRILPAFSIMLTVSIPAAWIYMLPGDLINFSNSLISSVLFYSNINYYFESGYFDTASELKPLLHTWSLAIEAQFYAVFPIAMIFVSRFAPRASAWLILAAFLASLTVAQWASANMPSAAFYVLPTRMWEFLLGALAALCVNFKISKIKPYVKNSLSLLGLACIAYAVFFFTDKTPIPGVKMLIPNVGAVLVILYAAPGTIVFRLMSAPAMRYIGAISFSLYIWHYPLFAFQRYRSSQGEILPFEIFVIVVITLVLSMASYHFVEKGWGRNVSNKALSVWSLGAVLLIACVGIVLTKIDSYDVRYSQNERFILDQYNLGADYIVGRFDERVLSEFDVEGERPKVLIIGDSYAQDLVNVVFEANLDTQIQVSTYYIPVRCGNVFTEDDLTELVDAADLPLCRRYRRYDDPVLLQRMREADQVWLASYWRDWQAEYLEETILNISRTGNAEVVVFGSKRFGPRSQADYLNGGVDALLDVRSVEVASTRVMQWMARNVPEITTYIDVQDIVCQSYFRCRNTLDGALPLSSDGGHLTPSGAAQVGEVLRPYLVNLIE